MFWVQKCLNNKYVYHCITIASHGTLNYTLLKNAIRTTDTTNRTKRKPANTKN